MRDSRTLYLDGESTIQVRLDGPALLVTGEGRCPKRFPFRRFTRVLVSGNVEWSTPALLACLERSIAIVFLGKTGELVGLCLGKGLPVYDRATVFEEFSNRPDWPEYYATWRTAMERRMILKLVRKIPLRVPDMRTRTVALECKNILESLGRKKRVWRTVGFLEGAAATAAAEILMEEGIMPMSLVYDRHDIHLGRDLARLVAWDARLVAIRFLRKREEKETSEKTVLVKEAEHRMPYWRHLASECLDNLERIAIGLQYGHH